MAIYVQKQCLITLFLVILGAMSYAKPTAENNNTEETASPQDCHKICGCDRSGFMAVQYNDTTKTCVVSFKHLMIAEVKIYGNQDDESEEGGTISEGNMSNKIRIEAERIFNTIMVLVLLFISCCLICVLSACFYCCRITYSDYTLQNDVKALTKKLKRDGKIQKIPKQQPQQTQANQSCNIIIEDAGVFVY